MRLLAYIRVSTDDQVEQGHSLGLQPDRLAAYCALHGHQLVGQFQDEGVSASVPLAKRQGGTGLLAALRAGEADGVVVIRLDRLFRSALDGLSFFEGFANRHTVAVHSVSELIDTSTPAGRLNLTIQLAAAQYERDLAVQRAEDNTRGLRQAGKVYGHVPYGCRGVDGRLFRCPDTWPVRARIVRLRDDGYSLGTIASLLRDEGYLAPNGGDRWSKSTLAAICSTHESLLHLPELPAQLAEQGGATPEAEVSSVRTH